jgi:intracellular septation protein
MRAWLALHPLWTKKILTKLFVGSFLDFSPALIFIATFELSNFYTATVWFMVSTVVVCLFAVLIEKRVPYFSIYISAVTLLFGASTLFFRSPDFIQIRDTVYDLVLALTLGVGYLKGRLLLKRVFSHSIQMSDKAWLHVTQAWVIFFIFGALLNEIIRRVFDVSGWVCFKSGMLLVTFFFGIWVLFYFYQPASKE